MRPIAACLALCLTAAALFGQATPPTPQPLPGVDMTLRPAPARTFPQWQCVSLERLEVFQEAVRQLRRYGLEPDFNSAQIVREGQAWEYSVSIKPTTGRLALTEEDRAWLSTAGDKVFRPTRLIVVSQQQPGEGISLPIVAFEGGEMTLAEPAAAAQSAKGLFGHWGSWQPFGTSCNSRIWCSKTSCGRCATYRVEYRHKYDNKGRVTKTDYRYKVDHCGC